MAFQETLFRISDGRGRFGLNFEGGGIALAGVPLLHRGSDGVAPRPVEQIAALMARAYGDDIDASRLNAGLGVVARALDAGNTALATTAAVLLKLPDLDWAGAVRIAQAEEGIRKYRDDEPRDWHGRWTDVGGGDPLESASDPTETFALPDDWIHLPPGERIDELGDLAEWIANAKPQDELAIRADIRRLYYDVGDGQGGDGITRFLDDALKPGISIQDRQAILDQLDHFTNTDPKEAAGYNNIIIDAILTAPFLGLRGTTGVAAAVVPEAEVVSSVWKLGWASRGIAIEAELGGYLKNYPVIDSFLNCVATSIKSIDLNGAVYQNPARLSARVNAYVDKVASFNGAKWGRINIASSEIKGRALNLVVPRGSSTVLQRSALEAARVRAKGLGVDLIITPF